MKPFSVALLAILATAGFVHSQDEPSVDSLSTARIIGDIPDGTPPPPQPPNPGFTVDASDVLDVKTYQESGRTITFQRIAPIALPPPPEPPPAAEIIQETPPQPKNITLNYWRIGEHIPASGGAR